MYRLLENIRDGKASMGLLTKGGPNLVRHQASAGADFIIADMMHSRLEWDEASQICWIARADGVYPFIRIQGHPWGSAANIVDRRFSVDAMRALTIGAEGVMFSVTSADEVRSVAHLISDWHQGKPVTSPQGVKDMQRQVAETRLLIPLIELRTGLDQIEEILAIDGIGGVFMAMTDLSHQLGHPHEYEHPDVWAAVDKAVRLASEPQQGRRGQYGIHLPLRRRPNRSCQPAHGAWRQLGDAPDHRILHLRYVEVGYRRRSCGQVLGPWRGS